MINILLSIILFPFALMAFGISAGIIISVVKEVKRNGKKGNKF